LSYAGNIHFLLFIFRAAIAADFRGYAAPFRGANFIVFTRSWQEVNPV